MKGGRMWGKLVSSLMDGVDFNAFIKRGAFYLNELRNFHFLLSNPLLWIIFFVSFLILSSQWGAKKSFSFCLIITVVLVVTTAIESYVPNTPGVSELFDFTIVKLISIFIIMLISIYYVFVK